ncbi:hypothetical protein GCM10009808_13990 [Microbacterium sediminicola]|uniref:HTH lacI-type domain-containing protein n=1 Tax=Microbacterium sediminicola TaxID=415210 RepID=A0ABN2I2Y1_9MICO
MDTPPARATLKDVAQHAGVSTAAVSQALNDRGSMRPETRERILEAAAALGYAPDRFAAALRRGRTMSIGYVSTGPGPGADEGHTARATMRQLNSLVDVAAEHGYTVTVIPADRPDLLGAARVDAVYAPTAEANAPALSEAAARGIPIITTDVRVPAAAGTWIRTGYAAATTAALDHLRDSGCERVGFLTEAGGLAHGRIGEQAYLEWCLTHRQDPAIVRVRRGRPELTGPVRELMQAGADGVFSFYQEGPELFLGLSRTDLVLPRDLQVVALCVYDCDLNDRLGVTHVCVHPDAGPRLLLPALAAALAGGPALPTPLVLPWELVPGATTRPAARRGDRAQAKSP